MPLLLAIPIISGLVGLFAGSQVENKINNPAAPIGTNNQAQAPWYVTPLLVLGVIVLVIVIARGFLKKSKIIA